MGFLGVYKAIYDYVPQGESELAISEGDILYVLEKSGEDDWWRAKKRATAEDDDEPVGLIPNNYIEEATPISHARALFDYTRQTDEELSFSEDTQLEVFDTSDPDWILVGHDNEYGFVPANYIDLEGGDKDAPPTPARPTASTSRQSSGSIDHSNRPESPSESAPNPAAAIASIVGGRAPKQVAPPPMLNFPPRPQQFTPEASDEEEAPTPSLPVRPQSQTVTSPSIYDRELPRSPPSGVIASPPHNRVTFRGDDDDGPTTQAPQGFHLYNINEMVSVMGKKKKMPTTLGINLATGTIMIAPEKARDGASQEWTAEKLTYYSIEGKHVFLELVRPSKSVDFHAGAKDTAHEIDGALRDLAGAVKAEGLKEVLMAASGGSQKTGKALHEFMAQGDDEVSVAVDDEVIILDDTKSDDWWHIRRVKNGKEGVVPSSYLEITGILAAKSTSRSGINAGRSTVEQNRLEEQRLTREASRAAHGDAENEVGPGMRLPERNSSLSMQIGNQGGQQRGRDPNPNQAKSTKSKPDPKKVRTWTDRSKSFSVEAQFLVLKDGKINLHKTNGVKIAVPVVKMSVEDLEYVEGITGVSLDEDKPLSDIKRQRARAAPSNANSSSSAPAGASVERKEEYDWFPFFLSCDVQVGLCERYAQIFSKGSMDESVMPDIDATVLRNLGIKEGDIIKIMRVLDAKYNRNRKRDGSEGDAEGGGLFSGPGGSLRNNTRKGRPAPAVQTSDIVDPKAFSQGDGTPSREFPEVKPQPRAASPPAPNGFDDNAWDKPKPAVAQPQPQVSRPASTPAAAPPQNAFTQSMKELSLLDMPALEPTKVQPPPSQPIQLQSQPQQSQPAQQQQAPQQTGATPAFFSGVNQQPTGQQQQYQQGVQFNQPQSQQNIARQRPVAPQYTQNTSSLMIPPPPRPLSAPQTAQQSAFGPPPLQPQMTGVPSYQSPQLAPPGQSLAEMNQMRMQQQYQQQQTQQPPNGFGGQQGNVMMQQPTGFQGYGVTQQQNGFGQPVQPQQTGFVPHSQFGMGNQAAGPFADARGQQFSPIQAQPTGFQSSFPQPGQQFPQQTGVGGVNQFLPPALIPQPTAMQQQPTGMNGFGQNSFGQPPPIPPMPQQHTMTPLQPQKTGPPPPIRFGVTGDTKKLMPQATGRRANLSQATPQNPFGF